MSKLSSGSSVGHRSNQDLTVDLGDTQKLMLGAQLDASKDDKALYESLLHSQISITLPNEDRRQSMAKRCINPTKTLIELGSCQNNLDYQGFNDQNDPVQVGGSE